jgi:hypothetical protein
MSVTAASTTNTMACTHSHISPDSKRCAPSCFSTSSSHSLSLGPPLHRQLTSMHTRKQYPMHSPEKHRSYFSPVFVQLHWQFDA